jgi:hypothetical protein
VGALVVFAMCSACGGDPVSESQGLAQTSIINGTIDTANPAAVAFTNGGFPMASCSGSIVKVDPPWAWVLTAAHCVDTGSAPLVAVGHLNAVEQELMVVEVMDNPDYDSGFHTWWNDYAVVRVMGADNTTPVMPIAADAEDTLAVGDVITLAGFGRTENGSPSVERRSIDLPIDSIDSDTFTYDQTPGGICFGDSGGPAFADLAAGRRVVGVTTVVANDQCTGWAGSARVSSVLSTFVQPRLDKPTFDTCYSCFGSAFGSTSCKALLDACFAMGSDCEAYSNCASGCSGDQTCLASCETAHAQGKAEYDAMMACPCDKCSPLCDDEPTCGGPQAGCGFLSNDAACDTCISGCCAEARACADDNDCYSCFPDCANPNANHDALWQCLDDAQCIDTCGLQPLAGTGGSGSGSTSSSSSSVATSSGVGPTSGVTTATTTGGVGGAGSAAQSTTTTSVGVGGSDGFHGPAADEDDDETAAAGCATTPRPGSAPPWWALAVGLCLLVSRKRPRTRGGNH